MKRDAVLKGARIAETRRLRPEPGGTWHVRDSKKTHRVCLEPAWCSCPSFGNRRRAGHTGFAAFCKHLWAAQLTVWWETNDTGALASLPVKVSEVPLWKLPRERKAPRTDGMKPIPFPTSAEQKLKKAARERRAEAFTEEHLPRFLYEICCDQPDERDLFPRKGGPNPWPLRHMVFLVLLKTALARKSRSLPTHFRTARENGFLPKDREPPHPNTVLDYCGRDDVKLTIGSFVMYTVQHLKGIEHDFAIDESEFGQQRPLQGDGPRKVHLQVCCGLKTGAFMDAMVTGGEHESKFLADLVLNTAEFFNVRSVVADGAYSEEECYRVIDLQGAAPLIPFDDNATGKSSGECYRKWLRVWREDRKRFDDAMIERRKVESWFNSLKSKHGGKVTSGVWERAEGELLAKVVCHNIRRAVFAAFEHRIKPEWWPTK